MYLLLRRSNLVAVVVGQPTSNPPQIEFIHTHQKIRNNPLSHHVVSEQGSLVSDLPFITLPIVQKYKNMMELKFQTQVWALLIYLVLCLLSLWFTSGVKCWFLGSNPLEFRVLVTFQSPHNPLLPPPPTSAAALSTFSLKPSPPSPLAAPTQTLPYAPVLLVQIWVDSVLKTREFKLHICTTCCNPYL